MFGCGRLLQDTFLRGFVWIIGTGAMVTNGCSFLWQLKRKTKSDIQDSDRLMCVNMAFSDMLMGVYLATLGVVDTIFRDSFFKYSDQWRASLLCRMLNLISMLAAETTLGILTLMTINRFICVAFPFSTKKLRKFSTKVSVGCIWGIMFIIAILSSLLANPESDFYGLSDVCLGLPLSTRPDGFTLIKSANLNVQFASSVKTNVKPSWYMSLSLFLGLNGILLFSCLTLYIVMFVSVTKSEKISKGTLNMKREIKIASRMLLFVSSNILCWMPIIFVGLLIQFEVVQLPLRAYAWFVIIILPVNAFINPYLYTLFPLI